MVNPDEGTTIPEWRPYREIYSFVVTRPEDVAEFKKAVKEIPFHQKLNNKHKKGYRK